jgi:hypothetical protein
MQEGKDYKMHPEERHPVTITYNGSEIGTRDNLPVFDDDGNEYMLNINSDGIGYYVSPIPKNIEMEILCSYDKKEPNYKKYEKLKKVFENFNKGE